jgi:hypothetical protein
LREQRDGCALGRAPFAALDRTDSVCAHAGALGQSLLRKTCAEAMAS